MSATNHRPGSFCWFELATTDQAAAKAFYQAIFGWDSQDTPMGPTEVYSVFKLDGQDAAAGYTMRAEQRAQGVPPNWLVYILVANADETAKRAKALGGTVVADPFDVMDHGRMAMIQDPTGAMFAIWQPKQHAGTGITGVHGTAVWADLNTKDQERGARFYRDLFGWKTVAGKDMAPAKRGDYFHIVNGAEFIGGMPPAAHVDPHSPPHWLTYFDVASADRTIADASSRGGRVVMPPTRIEDTRTFAVLADPQGAVFAIVESHPASSAAAKDKARVKAPKQPAAESAGRHVAAHAAAQPVKAAAAAPATPAKALAKPAKAAAKTTPAPMKTKPAKPTKAAPKRAQAKPPKRAKTARKPSRRDARASVTRKPSKPARRPRRR